MPAPSMSLRSIASSNLLCQFNGVVGVAMQKEDNKQLFYLWFALSLLLNVSGIASIVDGFVHWAYFFRDFLDLYRHWIREPLSWAVHLVFPFWQIPP
jgi:hypothetical protein